MKIHKIFDMTRTRKYIEVKDLKKWIKKNETNDDWVEDLEDELK